MTDKNFEKDINVPRKQIIIDNIDVSGCEYYDKNKRLLTCTCEEYACSECHNCYYKQFKRAEQKLAKIKRILVINKQELEETLMHDYDEQILQIIEDKDNE